MGSGLPPEVIVCEDTQSHPQMQDKALSSKEQAKCEHY